MFFFFREGKKGKKMKWDKETQNQVTKYEQKLGKKI